MNEISLLLNFIIERFKADSLVNTIQLGSDFEVDIQKENIYPLVAINYVETDPEEDSVIGYFDIQALQQRDVEPSVTDNKLLIDTNFIDNMNETHAICNKFIQYLLKKNNPLNVEIVSKSRVKAIKERPSNSLDGHKFSIALSIPNKTTGC